MRFPPFPQAIQEDTQKKKNAEKNMPEMIAGNGRLSDPGGTQAEMPENIDTGKMEKGLRKMRFKGTWGHAQGNMEKGEIV